TGGIVNLTGTLDNTSAVLDLDGSLGTVVMAGSMILGGQIDGSLSELRVQHLQSGILDGVTLNASMTLTGSHSLVTVQNDLVLGGTVYLNSNAGGSGLTDGTRLVFEGDSTLSGAGTVVFGGLNSNSWLRAIPGHTLTIGPGVTIRTGDRGGTVGYEGTALVNQGTIRAETAGHMLIIAGSGLYNEGILEAYTGGTLSIRTPVATDGLGLMKSTATGTVEITSNLLGTTQNADQYDFQGALRVAGSGTIGTPQLFEVMGQDLGPASSGFSLNFAYGTLALTANTYVQLADQSDNASGSTAEAVYVNSLIVPTGTTLDLNGLALYVRASQITGSIIGGTVIQIPDSGPISLAVPTPGTIAGAGEIDEWVFFGRSGRTLTVVVNPGGSPPATIPPYLNWAEVQLLDPSEDVLDAAASSLSGEVVKLYDVVLPNDGAYTIRIQAASEHSGDIGNYLVTVWDSTPDVTPLLLNSQITGRIENPYSVDRWTFTAVADQQVRLELIGTSGCGVVFDLTGPEDWIGFSDLSTDSDLIMLPTPGAYTLVVHTTEDSCGGTYAFRLRETTQIDLPLDTPYNGQFVGSAQAQLFRVNMLTSNPLRVVLDDTAVNNVNELYIKFGNPPTRSDYHYRFTNPASADQMILVPMAYVGDWYVLVYGDIIQMPSNYTLTASASPVLITDVTPDRHGATATIELTMLGAGFDSSTTAALVSSASGIIYSADSVTVDSFAQMRATFNLIGVSPGQYSVRVSKSGSADLLPEAFTLLGSTNTQLKTGLVVPSNMGYHAVATLYAEYANTGDVAILAPLLMVRSADPEGDEQPLLTLDYSRVTQGFWTSAMPTGFANSVQFLGSGQTAGVLNPGESAAVPVYYAGMQRPWNSEDRYFEFELRILRAEDTTPVDWPSLKSSLRPKWINPEAWDVVYSNLTANIGDTWGDYVRMLDENAVYLSHLGQNVTDISKLWSFEVLQAIGMNPLGTLASAYDLVVPAPGLVVDLNRVYAESLDRRFVLGPFGYGWSTAWSTTLQVQSDGAVEIFSPGGSIRRFEPDSRTGRYFAPPGEVSFLNPVASGGFTLQEADGFITCFLPDGKMSYIQDTNGNRITASYTDDRLTGLTHSVGQWLSISYNAAGRITRVDDSLGRFAEYTYDVTDEHLLTVQDYRGLVTQYAYISGEGPAREHALTSIALPDGTHQYYDYDATGRLEAVYRDGHAEQITFGYDTMGTVTVTDAAGATSLSFYDYQGIVAKSEDALGNILTYSFDDLHRVSDVTDSMGRLQSFTYACCGVITSQTDAMGNVQSFTYVGPPRSMDSSTDANGNTILYSVDANGNRTTITYPDNSLERYTWDTQGNLTSVTNRRGETISYTYNAMGQVTRGTLPDGSFTDYTYDGHGNLLSVTDSSGTVSMEYDAADRRTKITYPDGRFLEFTYDSVGRRTSMADHTGWIVNYSFDTAGRLYQLTDSVGSNIITYTYDAAGHLVREDKGNGTYTTYEYDLTGQVVHLINHAPDDSINSRFDYEYDSAGRVITMSTLDGQWTYEYDSSNQLTHAIFVSLNPSVPDQDLTYVYDAAGNRIRTIENGVVTEYVANELNQYNTVGDATYTYDEEGNLVAQIGGAYDIVCTYDYKDRLIRVVTPEGMWEYEYDALDNRTAIVHNGQRTEFLVDPVGLSAVVGEFSNSGDVLAHYVYGLSLIGRADPSSASAHYYDFDALGSTAGLSGGAGAYENRYAYQPFGEKTLSEETVPNSFEFVAAYGVMEEATGLQFMRARFYDPTVGRFLSEDPLQTPAANQYTYVNNTPTTCVDPTGLSSYADCMRRCLDVSYNYVCGQICRLCPFEVTFLFPPDSICSACFECLRKSTMDLLTCDRECQDNGDGGGSRPTIPITPPGDSGGGGGAGGATAADPNEKEGVAGFGSASYVAADEILAYRIDFENEETATAPAQQVIVTDQLDTNLDWGTFRLTKVGFGDQLIAVPPGAQHFETSVPFAYSGVSFEVQIEVNLDAATGEVQARFYSINAATGLPPSVLVGFLPPEDGTGCGMGHISYTIKPRVDLATGTEIRNVALISFDGQPQIATNQVDPHDPLQGTDPAKECLNTIDADGPTSQIDPLPTQTNMADFLVSWSGMDDAGGCGIAYYEIYVSDNAGPFVLWLEATTDTSATFTGEDGHTYAFYSIAIDNVGHLEAAPVASDTETMILLNDPPVANNDTVTTEEDVAVVIDVLANDTDVDVGDTLSVSAVTHGAHGTVTNNGTDVTYTPNANYHGTDSFIYEVSDGNGGTDTATVTVTVNPVNDPPVANDDTASTPEDTAILINVLANDNGGPPDEDQ
ncbi:MAG: hypothetical protein AMJ46_14050, partial [Latescibacteria bacterium DG_63]